MREKSIVSLLPYLNAKNGFRIAISVQPVHSPGMTDTFPFRVFDNDDPLIRTIHAAIVSDQGGAISEILLVVQRDRYTFKSDGFWPLNNLDIEKCWQKAFKINSPDSSEGQTADPTVLFARQIETGSNSAVAFHSLFYCRKRNHYFHPPCPTCGNDLLLCTDDPLLRKFGLAPYTNSLKRYLYCPTCTENKGMAGFYKYVLEEDDPRSLNDCRILIMKFGTVPQAASEDIQPHTDQNFICPACPHKQECFGEARKALDNIAPLAFYPFYMQITAADKLKATTFLKLLAGAELKEIATEDLNSHSSGFFPKQNQIRRHLSTSGAQDLYFFRDDPRFFLEILYLKIVFLQDLVEQILANQGRYRAEFGLSLDRIHVKTGGVNKLLPFWWNFKISIVDIGGRTPEISFLPNLPPAYALHFLGIVWFFVLLENKNQNRRDIYQALEAEFENLLADLDEGRGGNEKNEHDVNKEREAGAVFRPQNIFYNPVSYEIPDDWLAYWKRVLDIGWRLIRASMQKDGICTGDNILEELQQLRGALRPLLFTMPVPSQQQATDDAVDTTMTPEAAPVEQADVQDDLSIQDKQQIYTILQGVKAKLKEQAIDDSAEAAPAPLHPIPLSEGHQPDQGDETVILKPSEETDVFDEDTITVYHDHKDQFVFDDTGKPVDRPDNEGSFSLGSEPDDSEASDIFEETFVISTEKATEIIGGAEKIESASPPENQVPESHPVETGDQLDKTVIIREKQVPEQPSVEQTPKKQTMAVMQEDTAENVENPDQTVIIPKTGDSGRALNTTAANFSDDAGQQRHDAENSMDDDQLSRTMIINPKKVAASMRKKTEAQNQPGAASVTRTTTPATEIDSVADDMEDGLDKTVIIRSKPGGPKKRPGQ